MFCVGAFAVSISVKVNCCYRFPWFFYLSFFPFFLCPKANIVRYENNAVEGMKNKQKLQNKNIRNWWYPEIKMDCLYVTWNWNKHTYIWSYVTVIDYYSMPHPHLNVINVKSVLKGNPNLTFLSFFLLVMVGLTRKDRSG